MHKETKNITRNCPRIGEISSPACQTNDKRYETISIKYKEYSLIFGSFPHQYQRNHHVSTEIQIIQIEILVSRAAYCGKRFSNGLLQNIFIQHLLEAIAKCTHIRAKVTYVEFEEAISLVVSLLYLLSIMNIL